MKMLKHFTFKQADGRRGRFALAVTEYDRTRVVFRQLSGPAPQVGHLIAAVARFPELVAAVNRATDVDTLMLYAVDIRRGISGSRTYRVVVCRDAELDDYPVRSRVHVSMSGKLNEKFSVRAIDLPVLIRELMRDYPHDAESYRVEEARIQEHEFAFDRVVLALTDAEAGVSPTLEVRRHPDEFRASAVPGRLTQE